ncbi:MAG: hypothetical protein K1X57_01240 [Gemmataceae bacterium]|nr:hypothetical protein [Gemmataceae bacterium]
MQVVKVGGSLYDWPELGRRLDQFLGDSPTVIVPGGGMFAEAVRAFDRIHSLPTNVSHDGAIRAMSLAGRCIASMVPGLSMEESGIRRVVDVMDWPQDGWPVSWNWTSDSIAARIARDIGAELLVLLKSCDPNFGRWEDSGYVDTCFCREVADAAFVVRAVNLRNGASFDYQDYQPRHQ